MPRLWFAFLPVLFISPSIQAQCPRAAITPEEAKQQLEHCLNSPVSVEFKEMPFREVVECLRAKFKLPIVVDEPAMEQEGISMERPITLKLEDVSAKSTLNLLLHQVHLGWVIADGKVTITTERAARPRPVWKTHPIADLLVTEADYVEERSSAAIIDLIARSIAPNTWQDVGGLGEMKFQLDEYTLEVYQTPDIQEQVEELLDAVRRLEDRSIVYCQ